MELLDSQVTLRAASKGRAWPPAEDMSAAIALLPSAAWDENRASLIGHVTHDLLDQLVMAYSLLKTDRVRFVAANRLPAGTVLPPKEADGLKRLSDDLGRFRRQLDPDGGAWPDEAIDGVM